MKSILQISRLALPILVGLALSACQTMPQKEASVPSPLSDAEYARITQLPPESIAGTAAPGTQASGAEVFARLQAGFKAPVCTDGERSNEWQKRYAGNPRVFAEHLQQILPILDFVSKEVQTSGLPTEFALIPIVESWYRPDAMGAGGPAGMWQLIASTARNHGIRIQSGYDGRLSPVESTRAALSYLKTLHDMFDDWQATVMAYNAGEWRLIHAFERDGRRDVSGELRQPRGLSNITYDYVAKLQALSCLITEPQRQGLLLPVDSRFQTLQPVLMDENIRALDQVASQAGIDSRTLRALNPGYRMGRVSAGVPRLVLMPAQSGLASSLAHAEPVASAQVTVLPATAAAASDATADKPVTRAASDASEPVILAATQTSEPTTVAATETTAPANVATPDTSEPVAVVGPDTNALMTIAAADTGEAVTLTSTAAGDSATAPAPTNHQVRNGDTLWAIAKRYGLSLVDLRRFNGLGKNARIRPGQSLKLAP